jgi:uncharacterized protein (DUF927 family)
VKTTLETPETAARRLAAKPLRKGFVLEALHVYADATGTPLYWRIRAKHPKSGEKWIRPMKADGEIYLLGEPSAEELPAGKLLYRLHEVAAHPDQVVVVTEGELKADRLAALGLLVTTSGAADSAGKADWKPLAGRSVLIWPDNDEAGRRYADAVAAVLAKLDCEVRILDVAALGLPTKGDAVDWLATHPDAVAADVLTLPSLEPTEPAQEAIEGAPAMIDSPASQAQDASPPNSCRYGGGRFKLAETGVWFIGTDDDGNEKAPIWICSPIGVIAKTRDAQSGEWGRLLEWFDDDNVRHRWAMPLELLEGDGLDVRRELARLGVHIATTRAGRDLLSTYIKVWPVEQRARCVDRLGWHGGVYSTPHETIGDSGELVVFQNTHAVESALEIAGTADDWRDSVAALAAGNSRLVFALSAAFAGSLAGVAGEDSGGFHLRGTSSSGKSTALKAAASVWGDPANYARVWRSTTNGLEGLAALHNDGLLILDELSQCDPRQAGEAAYLLANGQGKARAARTGAARAVQRWRLLFLSAGEESLSALMARAGQRTNVGQEIRLADIDADAGAGMGAFEQLHGVETPAMLAASIKDAAAKHRGAVGIAWLHRIVQDRIRLVAFIAEDLRRFVAKVVPPEASGQVERVARRFGLVAVAGELATRYGLTGWQEGESQRAAAACFASWLEGFGSLGNREERLLLDQVRGFFEAHGASRFEDMAATVDQRIVDRAGFFRMRDGVREYLVMPEAFKNEVCRGLDFKAAERLLLDRSWIAPGKDGRPTQKPRLPGIGTAARVYVVTPRMWEGDA